MPSAELAAKGQNYAEGKIRYKRNMCLLVDLKFSELAVYLENQGQ